MAVVYGAGGSVIAWEVEVTDVLTTAYDSKSDSWKALRTTFPALANRVTRRAFLDDGYTLDARDQGWLLRVEYRPIRRIGAQRPPELRFRPNGWLDLSGYTDAQLLERGILAGPVRRAARNPAGKRAPWQADALKKIAVELRAMDLARTYLKSVGWADRDIHDTSANKPYDLECVHGAEILRVEVKGLSGPAAKPSPSPLVGGRRRRASRPLGGFIVGGR